MFQKKIFIVYIPKGNYEALVHYEDTIVNKVSQEKIFKYVDTNLRENLKRVFGLKSIAVWGSRGGDANRQKFDKMKAGDDIFIIEGNTIKLMGKIATTDININLSKELWKNIKGDSMEPWELIYFIANPVEIGLPFDILKDLFGYKKEWQLRGLTNISDDRILDFYSKYDDLYEILLRIKKGEKVEKKQIENIEEVKKIVEEIEENEETIKELSDHVKMQHKLALLGIKTGSKVWVPKNDQKKLREEFQFNDFEKEFTAGIDINAKYVENIDVVWKEEFRIDAAFEIENSTAIYSGLLRFADLKIVAPNSNYPLFIVAPQLKKHKVFEQVKRPTFREIDFDKKVHFLSYERIDEIDTFFQSSTAGLDINLLIGKSESIS
ncbi:MAG: hypothetical protein HYW86_04245 [Candidatus Roizmanbacteria bacterium]|nr:MAG: hypothetical protein HYW86_04245 [Candidatus Roizmanbacteria bacterium]